MLHIFKYIIILYIDFIIVRIYCSLKNQLLGDFKVTSEKANRPPNDGLGSDKGYINAMDIFLQK